MAAALFAALYRELRGLARRELAHGFEITSLDGKDVDHAVPPGEAEEIERLGTILARLEHPRIAQLIDTGVSEAGQPYLVLEYVEASRSIADATTRASTSRPASGFFSTCSPPGAETQKTKLRRMM